MGVLKEDMFAVVHHLFVAPTSLSPPMAILSSLVYSLSLSLLHCCASLMDIDKGQRERESAAL